MTPPKTEEQIRRDREHAKARYAIHGDAIRAKSRERYYNRPGGTGHPPRCWWTPEADAYLQEYWTNTPLRTMAEHLGRTENAVNQRFRTLGISRKRPAAGWVDVQGYRKVQAPPGHPNAKKHGTIAEHRLVMTEMLGRALLRGESVHHVNGVKTDNRPKNLELWSTHQPKGQRVEDKVAWALELIDLYGADFVQPGIR